MWKRHKTIEKKRLFSFEFEVVVRPGKLNVGPEHLSRIDIGEQLTGVEYNLPDAHLF